VRPWRPPYPKFGAGTGLVRVNAVAARLGLKLADFGANATAIVGSNGKGSTAAMTASLLQQSGASVGLFTSPHLLDLNERFRFDGEDIADAELARHWERVSAAIDAYQNDTGDQASAFEFLFLIAADWFKARGAALTVWEAGIGGRYDPVRLIEARRVALTSLDLEHTELLGDSLEAIARDKIDAAPRGAALFAPHDIEVRDVIEASCAANGVEFQAVAALAETAPLAGAHQRQNAALALALAGDLAPLSKAQARAGFEAVRWPGRLETIAADPIVVIDVGHTPRGVAAALAGFQAMRAGVPAVLVCGASRDKDGAAMIGLLAGAFDIIICASACHKGAPAGEIAAVALVANPQAEIIIAETMADAHRLARAKARAAKAMIYVAGGLFLAAEFKAIDQGRDPGALAFL
jgi:dihydrofolate synthase/folylpolyglutamate synthase